MSNFPQNLAITPSLGPAPDAGSSFGVTGQHKSIEQFGIAGRVW